MTATRDRRASSERADAVTVLADGELRYSTVWEDHRLLERGLRVREGQELLVVASAGCNVLALLRHAPRRLVALDCNPAQLALVELKLAALRTLERAAILRLLGVAAGADRLALYERVRPLLSPRARAWWDGEGARLERGIETSGRLDRHIAAFRRELHGDLVDRCTLERLFALDSPAERRRFVRGALDTPAVEALFRRHFDRPALAAHGRTPAQFRYVRTADVGGRLLARLLRACVALPTRDNPYLRRFLLGPAADTGVDEAGLPTWLRAETLPRLRPLAARVELVEADLATYLASRSAGSLDGAALSDVFEYLAPAASDALFARLAGALRPGGRIAYWNLLVRRASPAALRARLRPRRRLSRALGRRDRAWFYGAFRVEEAWRR